MILRRGVEQSLKLVDAPIIPQDERVGPRPAVERCATRGVDWLRKVGHQSGKELISLRHRRRGRVDSRNQVRSRGPKRVQQRGAQLLDSSLERVPVRLDAPAACFIGGRVGHPLRPATDAPKQCQAGRECQPTDGRARLDDGVFQGLVSRVLESFMALSVRSTPSA